MIIRKETDGQIILMGQTDHSRLVGQLAAHWGNRDFAVPEPRESAARAATYHDFGWLGYETSPLIDPETGEPYQFREVPFSQRQLDAYQWCVDWLGTIDPYAGLLVSMHRTGLWKARYGTITHPGARYNPAGTRPEIQEFITRNEAWQEKQRQAVGGETIWKSYHLLQVWDLLGLYFCCQEPYEEYIEPVPTSYADGHGVRLAMRPAGGRQVAFEPYPFDVRPLSAQIFCKRLLQASFPSLEAFRQAYFEAPYELLEYELL